MKTITDKYGRPLRGVQASLLHALWKPRTILEIRDFVYPDKPERGDPHIRAQIVTLEKKGFNIVRRGKTRSPITRNWVWKYEVRDG